MRKIILGIFVFSLLSLVVGATGISFGIVPNAFPRGLSYDESFSQTFHASPGSEWQSSITGAGQFLWDGSGHLRTVFVHNPGSEVDEYYRTQDVPTVTKLHDFAFSGQFRINSNTFGSQNHNGMVLGLGNSALAGGGFRQGVGVRIESTPDGSSVKVVARLGNPLEELSGNMVSIKGGALYEVYVKHFINLDGWVISAEVYAEDGSLVGISQAFDSTGLHFSADRIYLANDATLTDGGSPTVEWSHIGIEREIVPVFNTKGYQARVRVDPNDLLQICGYRLDGDSRVVYQRVEDTTRSPTKPPVDALTEKRVDFGTLEVVSTHGLPNSIVVYVPSIFASGRSYALWVGSPNRGWSRTMLVNDARPAWISPDRAYAADTVKIVGRNLDPDPAVGVTRVRLTGPSRYVLNAENDGDPSTGIENYAAQVTLPSEMGSGEYSVEVCRDNVSWVPLEDGTLTVLPVPIPLTRFDATGYGAIPNDGVEDTAAISAAIAAAADSGGGEVYLPPGTYNVREIELTRGVSLAGAGMNATRLSDLHGDAFVHEGWGLANIRWIISAVGHQTIRDLEFFDPLGGVRVYTQSNGIRSWLQLPPADEVTVSHCKFTGCSTGIFTVWSAPVKCWTIVYNEFMATSLGLFLHDGYLSYSKISHNVFYPSANGWNWPSELGGSRFVELSDNVADGTVNGGWRNGFFWNLSHSNEMVLISNNTLTATGDKGTGGGEGISFDANADGVAYDGRCAGATSETVTIPAHWTTRPDEFASWWVRIADGKGVGQSRRIVGHNAGELNRLQLVEPWDVLPDQGSWLVVTKLYWNVFVVDNLIDNRNQVALTNNRDGMLSFFGSASDCVIDSNTQYDSAGINLYTAKVPGQYSISYFNEIRNNLIDGEPNPPNSDGGIFLWYSVQEGWPAPVLGYGAVIKDNTISRSDYGGALGAITIIYSWTRPSTPYTWKEALIFGNRISDVNVGVHLAEPYVWNTVLFNNSATNVRTPLVDNGANTVNANAQLFVATPLIGPNGGRFNERVKVALSTTTAGATIRYTLDGSDPTATIGTVYSESPFELTSDTTVLARAFKEGMLDSEIAQALFDINQRPVVNAGEDLSVTLPGTASLHGTITDDEIARVRVSWSKFSGPGTVGFSNQTSVDTTATFTTPGSYTLRLTATDRTLGSPSMSVSDDLQVIVNPPIIPGDANGDGVVDISDPIRILFHLFSGMTLASLEAADVNADGKVDISDPTYLLNYLFRNGPAPLP